MLKKKMLIALGVAAVLSVSCVSVTVWAEENAEEQTEEAEDSSNSEGEEDADLEESDNPEIEEGYTTELEGCTKVVSWCKNGDNNIYGQFYYPEDFDETKTYPVIIMSHGIGSTSQMVERAKWPEKAGGRIIINKKIPIGGRQMNEAVCSEVRKRYNLQIGTRTGKRLKLVMGRLADQHKQARKVVGIDSVSGLPREEVISAYVVNAGIMNCVNEIGAQMKVFLERIPPQISYHIAKEGIFLTGGSTRIPHIDTYLASYTGYSFNLSDLYETSAVKGLEKIIHDRELRKWAQPITQRKL